MSKKLTFWSDPGHGWLEVPTAELKELGIENKISSYSYINWEGSKAYLEEDCDAGVYLNKLKENGESFEFDERFSNNIFIRELPSYSAHM